MAAIPTRTLNPLPFQDLEPHRFEVLVRQLVDGFRSWTSLEAVGRGGSDEGIDTRDHGKDGSRGGRGVKTGFHLLIVALCLVGFVGTAAAEVRDSESKCVQAMQAGVDRMGSAIRKAQLRTGKTVIEDDDAMFKTMRDVIGDVGYICNQARDEASDADRALIDAARSAHTSYLTIFGLPGDQAMKESWLVAVKRLQDEGGHARHP